MNKLLCVLLTCFTPGIYAAAGDITISNTNSKFNNHDSVSVQIVPTSSTDIKSFYAKNLSAATPGNSKILTSNDFSSTQKFDVYVADISQSGTFRRCLKNIPYSEYQAAITINASNTDLKPAYNQCLCEYNGKTHACEYPLNSYAQIRGSARIPW